MAHIMTMVLFAHILPFSHNNVVISYTNNFYPEVISSAEMARDRAAASARSPQAERDTK